MRADVRQSVYQSTHQDANEGQQLAGRKVEPRTHWEVVAQAFEKIILAKKKLPRLHAGTQLSFATSRVTRERLEEPVILGRTERVLEAEPRGVTDDAKDTLARRRERLV